MNAFETKALIALALASSMFALRINVACAHVAKSLMQPKEEDRMSAVPKPTPGILCRDAI